MLVSWIVCFIILMRWGCMFFRLVCDLVFSVKFMVCFLFFVMFLVLGWVCWYFLLGFLVWFGLGRCFFRWC